MEQSERKQEAPESERKKGKRWQGHRANLKFLGAPKSEGAEDTADAAVP